MRAQISPLSRLFFAFCFRKTPRSRICHRLCASYRLPLAVSPSDFRDDTVKIAVGTGGHIFLNVLQRIVPSPRQANVILYLPDGPLFRSPLKATGQSNVFRHLDEQEIFPSPQHTLASITLSTVVTVDYRLGKYRDGASEICYRYPTPVHDTLAGFDWIFQNLKPSQLQVFGKYIGGSLALMLALTEPRSISAVAAQDPVCDWVGLDDYCLLSPEPGESDRLSVATDHNCLDPVIHVDPQHYRKRGRKRKQPLSAPPDLVPLLEAREELFRIPENYFDSFASPALFLRSPGKDCPTSFPRYFTGPDYAVPVLETPPARAESSQLTTTAAGSDIGTLSVDDGIGEGDAVKPVRRRKVLSRWPPYGLDYGIDDRGWSRRAASAAEITLPQVRVFVNRNFLPDANSPLDISTPPACKYESNCGHSRAQNQKIPDPKRLDVESISRNYSLRIASGRVRSSGETVLARQGAEMVSLMHNTCFWGREKGFAEERVKLVRVPILESQTDSVAAAAPESKAEFIEEAESSRLMTRGDSRNPIMGDNSSLEETVAIWFRDILPEKISEHKKGVSGEKGFPF